MGQWTLTLIIESAPRNMQVFSGQRILIQAIRNPSLRQRIVAAFTDKTYITRINVYSLLKKPGTKLDLLSLLAILNSRLMNWLLMKDYGLHTYVITGVLALPMKHSVTDGTDGQMLSRHAEKIQSSKLQNADTAALEGEIDRLVYELYGLTEDEIAMVEGKS